MSFACYGGYEIPWWVIILDVVGDHALLMWWCFLHTVVDKHYCGGKHKFKLSCVICAKENTKYTTTVVHYQFYEHSKFTILKGLRQSGVKSFTNFIYVVKVFMKSGTLKARKNKENKH